MKLTPENVMRLGERLLKAKQELAAAQAEWDRLVRPADASLPNQNERAAKPSISDQIITFLVSREQEMFAADQVASSLNLNLGTAKTTLSRLVSSGIIEKRGHANYGAIRQSERVTSAALFGEESKEPKINRA